MVSRSRKIFSTAVSPIPKGSCLLHCQAASAGIPGRFSLRFPTWPLVGLFFAYDPFKWTNRSRWGNGKQPSGLFYKKNGLRVQLAIKLQRLSWDSSYPNSTFATLLHPLFPLFTGVIGQGEQQEKIGNAPGEKPAPGLAASDIV